MPHTHDAHTHSGSVTSYTLGFVSSLILTIVPYLLITLHLIQGSALVSIVVLCAITQLCVQMIAFLHLSMRPQSRTTTLAFLFTATMVWIIVIGSLWIMNNLAANMSMDQLAGYMHKQN